jgi:predicted CopG family antitoxin
MVSLVTCLIIQGNETSVHPYKDRDSQKWGYEVSRMERENYRPLVTCSAIYDSKEVAKKEGDSFVESIRELDLSPKRKEVGDLLGDSKEEVQQIIDTINNYSDS